MIPAAGEGVSKRAPPDGVTARPRARRSHGGPGTRHARPGCCLRLPAPCCAVAVGRPPKPTGGRPFCAPHRLTKRKGPDGVHRRGSGPYGPRAALQGEMRGRPLGVRPKISKLSINRLVAAIRASGIKIPVIWRPPSRWPFAAGTGNPRGAANVTPPPPTAAWRAAGLRRLTAGPPRPRAAGLRARPSQGRSEASAKFHCPQPQVDELIIEY